jgi:hypothetical protein
MLKKYVHAELGKEVHAPAGYYLPLEENILPYQGKKVLYILGSVCIESACCGGGGLGRGGWSYIQVPGYLLNTDPSQEKSGPAVSEIEAIENENDRHEITRLLLEKYPYARIELS